LSIDEVRENLGKHSIGMKNAVITTTGVFPLDFKPPQQDDNSVSPNAPGTQAD